MKNCMFDLVNSTELCQKQTSGYNLIVSDALFDFWEMYILC